MRQFSCTFRFRADQDPSQSQVLVVKPEKEEEEITGEEAVLTEIYANPELVAGLLEFTPLQSSQIDENERVLEGTTGPEAFFLWLADRFPGYSRSPQFQASREHFFRNLPAARKLADQAAQELKKLQLSTSAQSGLDPEALDNLVRETELAVQSLAHSIPSILQGMVETEQLVHQNHQLLNSDSPLPPLNFPAWALSTTMLAGVVGWQLWKSGLLPTWQSVLALLPRLAGQWRSTSGGLPSLPASVPVSPGPVAAPAPVLPDLTPMFQRFLQALLEFFPFLTSP